MKRSKDTGKRKAARVHEDLEGFELTVDQFGEIKSSVNIEKINAFLDRNVEDKKLTERGDFPRMRKGRKRKKR